MTPRVRAMVVYVASRLISQAESSFVFDFSGPGHRSMGGTVNEQCVNVYDYSENCQLTGHNSAGVFQLFHHQEKVHVSLQISGESFHGFDHGAGSRFGGIVNGAKISVYDEGAHRQYAYWCEALKSTPLTGPETGVAEIESDPEARESGPGNPIGE